MKKLHDTLNRKRRYCVIFQYDDSNCTKEGYTYDSYKEAFQALIEDFREYWQEENASEETIKDWLEEIECGNDRWEYDGKVWEIIPLYD